MFEVPPHPLGLLPWGNSLVALSTENNSINDEESNHEEASVRDAGLGDLHVLPDELVLAVLQFLDPQSLTALTCSSKCLYVFCHNEDLWRSAVLETFGGDFKFSQSWRHTFIQRKTGVPPPPSAIKVKGMYSDLLFQPWLCAATPIHPNWLKASNEVPRRSGLSLADFVSEFELPNTPVIFTDVVTKWPAFQKWSRDYLLAQAKDGTFSVGHFQMTLADYYTYADNAVDDQPMYLFDPKFCESMPELAKDYVVPEYFAEDLFGVLGQERPNYRWLIIGPAKSGSTFHVDPNQTSAWNAVIRGSKKWVFYPPSHPPPAIFPSADGADVAAPVSLMEWFISFYDEDEDDDEDPGCPKSGRMECILREGELLFVPRGWWHTAINLEETVAITQNYVSSQGLRQVLDFLKNKPNQVSGVTDKEDFHNKFLAKMRERHPDAVVRVEAEREARKKRASLFAPGGNANKKRHTDDGAATAGACSFSFGFA